MTDPLPRRPRPGRPPVAPPRLALVPATAPETADSTDVRVDARTSGLVWARRFRAKLLVSDVAIVMAAVPTALLVRFGGEGAQASVAG